MRTIKENVEPLLTCRSLMALSILIYAHGAICLWADSSSNGPLRRLRFRPLSLTRGIALKRSMPLHSPAKLRDKASRATPARQQFQFRSKEAAQLVSTPVAAFAPASLRSDVRA